MYMCVSLTSSCVSCLTTSTNRLTSYLTLKCLYLFVSISVFVFYSLGLFGIKSLNDFLHAPPLDYVLLCTLFAIASFLLETRAVWCRRPSSPCLASLFPCRCLRGPPNRHLERLLPILARQINAVRWRALL
ncbi:hypothetical protein HDV57DRAFT_243960 [Trichoderma longibrachiatum]